MDAQRNGNSKKRRIRYRFGELPNLTRKLIKPSSEQEKASSTPQGKCPPTDISLPPRAATMPVPEFSRPQVQASYPLSAPVEDRELGVLGPQTDSSSPRDEVVVEEYPDSGVWEIVLQDSPENFEVPGPEAATSPPVENAADDENLQILDWKVLWGLFATNGTNKLTKQQYQSLRNLIAAVSPPGEDALPSTKRRTLVLPHFTALHRTYRPLLLKSLVPRIEEGTSDVNPRKAGARTKSFSLAGTPQCRVAVILPSEYARADMSTGPVWSLMMSTSLIGNRNFDSSPTSPSISTSDCIDTWPLIGARKWFYGPESVLYMDEDDDGTVGTTSQFAEIGDEILVTLLNDDNEMFPERLQRCFGSTSRCGKYRAVEGQIVHHSKRRHDPLYTTNLCMTCHVEIGPLFGFSTLFLMFRHQIPLI